MLRRMRTLAAGLVVPAAFGLSSPLLVGCNSGDQTGKTTETASADNDEHGHEHGPGTHEAHGDEGGHSHPSEGPHGGQILEFGSADYHAELVHDEQLGAVTVYILDSGATTATPVEAAELTVNVRQDGEAKQYRLTASPEAGETDGKSSRFTTEDATLGEALHAGAEARLVAKIGGRSYNAAIEHSHDHGHAHGHSHTGDDALVWRQEGVKEGDYTIALGHHGTELHAGQPVEPAVMVTKDGEDVADAKVFNALLTEDGTTVLAEEKPTVFEPKTAEEPAHYAQGELAVPKDAKKVVLRFRVVLPEGGEKTFDVPVDVK